MFTHLLGSCELHIPSSSWHLNALELRSMFSLSYWDSLIVAAALEAGCHTLISEDMQHQQQIDGLRIINPFK
jgi:predicted nucleic acid-binding protein